VVADLHLSSRRWVLGHRIPMARNLPLLRLVLGGVGQHDPPAVFPFASSRSIHHPIAQRLRFIDPVPLLYNLCASGYSPRSLRPDVRPSTRTTHAQVSWPGVCKPRAAPK